MINSVEFTKRLKKIMEYYNLSASALAERIDFNRSSISHLISGRNKPSLEFVLKILENFSEVNWEWLVFGNGYFPTDENTRPKNYAMEVKSKKKEKSIFDDKDKTPPIEKLNSSIERIVIFYKNGSFKSFESL